MNINISGDSIRFYLIVLVLIITALVGIKLNFLKLETVDIISTENAASIATIDHSLRNKKRINIVTNLDVSPLWIKEHSSVEISIVGSAKIGIFVAEKFNQFEYGGDKGFKANLSGTVIGFYDEYIVYNISWQPYPGTIRIERAEKLINFLSGIIEHASWEFQEPRPYDFLSFEQYKIFTRKNKESNIAAYFKTWKFNNRSITISLERFFIANTMGYRGSEKNFDEYVLFVVFGI